MDKVCAICGRTYGLNELNQVWYETDAGEPITRYVCSTCWKIIVGIVLRAIDFEAEIERFLLRYRG